MGQLPDDELVRAAQAGERPAWDAIVDRWQEDFYRYVRRLCRCDADARDITQASFALAIQRLDSLREPAAFAGWLRRIGYNEAMLLIRNRRGRRFGSLEEADLDSDAETPLTRLQQKELIRDLHDCVESLGDRKAAAVSLVKLQGLSFAEAASALDVPPGTVSSRVTNSMQQLRVCLESKGYGDDQ